jgi:uncharacterized protein (TIGR03437 family)
MIRALPADITGMRRLFPLMLYGAAAAAQSGPTVTPATVAFTYQMNSPTLPAPAKLTASLPAAIASLPLTAVVVSSPVGWLTVTPDSGHAPFAMTVTVNPTSLTPGSYTGTITINTVPSGGNPAVVSVTLSITNPPSTLVVGSPSANYSPPASGATSPSLTFTYTTGAAAPSPATAELDVASNGDIIPFNVAASAGTGKPSSGSGSSNVWVRVNGSGQLPGLATSGVALSGSSVPISVSIDQAILNTLNPGSYAGLITIAATSAVNGSATVAVNLIVSAGPPTLNASLPIFPSSLIAGPAIDPVITVYGDNFFSTSVVTMQSGTNPPISLPSVLLSRKVLQATIKAAYLAPTVGAVYPMFWTLAVTNPAPPNNPTQAAVTTVLRVTSPTQPAITSVVNAASYLPAAIQTGTGANPIPLNATAVSPREIISIFGQNLGPASITTTTPAGTPAVYPTVANGMQVIFTYGVPASSTPAPIIVTSDNQINCIVPVELASVIGTGNNTASVTVVNGLAATAPFPVTVIAEDPGVFTFGGLGQGQGAVLNFDSSTGSYTINGGKAAAPRGSAVAIYVTGMGNLGGTTPVANGEVASTAILLADGTARVDIDGQPAVVSYAGTAPGAVAGLVQINAIVPPTVRAGAAIPMTVSIGSAITARRSQPGVTIAVK